MAVENTVVQRRPAKNSLAGMAAIMVTAILWGTTGTAATFAPEVGPIAMGAAALGVGGLLQGLIAIPELRNQRIALKQHRILAVLGALGVFIYPLAFYSSMHLAGVVVGTVVSLGTAPIASGLLEWVVDKQRPTRRWMLAAVVGIIGSSVLCISKMGDSPDDMTGIITGVGLGLVAGFTYALYSWSAFQMMSRGVGRAAAMGSIFGLGGLAVRARFASYGCPTALIGAEFCCGRLYGTCTDVHRLRSLRLWINQSQSQHRNHHHARGASGCCRAGCIHSG